MQNCIKTINWFRPEAVPSELATLYQLAYSGPSEFPVAVSLGQRAVFAQEKHFIVFYDVSTVHMGSSDHYILLFHAEAYYRGRESVGQIFQNLRGTELSKKETVFQRYFIKIQITSLIFIVKGLNTVSHACSMNHKQLMNMHLWNGR